VKDTPDNYLGKKEEIPFGSYPELPRYYPTKLAEKEFY
jgi:hypothetical protein|tara:strand:+ start:505 stop:618 length:114 start_codon:yes stop_codon:yes gene_type:complete